MSIAQTTVKPFTEQTHHPFVNISSIQETGNIQLNIVTLGQPVKTLPDEKLDNYQEALDNLELMKSTISGRKLTDEEGSKLAAALLAELQAANELHEARLDAVPQLRLELIEEMIAKAKQRGN